MDNSQLQLRYDQARVLFSAKTMTAFQALKHDDLYVKALIPHRKLTNKSARTISRHTDRMADDVRRDLLSIIQSVLEEKE